MDGFQERLKSSLRLQLSCALASAILLMALLAGAASFYLAFEEANELQDDTLREVAAILVRQGGAQGLAMPFASEGRNKDARVLVQPLDGTGRAAPGALALPRAVPDGLSTQEVGGTQFRVLVSAMADGRRFAVAQETDVRDDAATDSAWRTMLPLLALIAVLLLIVAALVRKLVAPVANAALELDQRDQHDLRPVSEQALPVEVKPFVVALNRMLARLGAAMDGQRRFVADAAHELRSPMAAIALQAERLASAPMSPEAAERLQALRQGIERGKTLLDQLLSLARVQARLPRAPDSADVHPVLIRVLEDLLPLAELKSLDVGLSGVLDAQVLMSEAELHMLVRNLVDNAIRYSPPHGQIDVDVQLDANGVHISVIDAGPGIPPEEHEHVFAPFHRLGDQERQGTGLGLAIVAAIVQKYGGAVSLRNRHGDGVTGLIVELQLPANARAI
jgi:two-component system OmpR family sensor kinase